MKKIRVSDLITQFLVDKKINDVFLVSGGGIMHLVDAVGKQKGLNYVANRHEQACAIGAEAWARMKNSPSACIVTTGPGGTNALTGAASAWMDSIPVLIISGQVRTGILADYSKHRQIGPQEINIVDMAQPITKYAKTILDPKSVLYELEKAFSLATEGRPGPVWLDIPLDVQAAIIETTHLKRYHPQKKKNLSPTQKEIETVLDLLENAKRPILILGNGVRLAHAEKVLEKFVKKIGAPILLPYNGMDLIPENHPLLMGKFGPVGQRRGNFALQNSDFVLSVGAGLSIASTGFDFKNFAPQAKIVSVNIDKNEMKKPTIKIDYAIEADAKAFIETFLQQTEKSSFEYDPKWKKVCKHWKEKYPSIVPSFFKEKKYVNTYVFFDQLSDLLTAKDAILTGNSLDAVCLYQAFKVKKGQRAFTNANLGSMGWGLPASIGACLARNKKRTILVTGDGSIQFNIQELATIAYYQLPIKIFVVNNEGYESIRTTQESHFSGNYVGSDKNSGVNNPKFKALAFANSLPYVKINNNSEIHKKIIDVLNIDGPVLCELHVDPQQHREPKAASFKKPDGSMESRPLEDMSPFLPREEMQENMNFFNNTNKETAL